MKTTISLATISVLFLLASVSSSSQAVELARVGDYSITSDEYLSSFSLVSPTNVAPERTPEGKKEFLDRLIAKHLLSQYFHSQGWDTLSNWDDIVAEYGRGQYLQALYFDAIPEMRMPVTEVPADKLREMGKQFVDSLQNAYKLKVDENAVTLLADRSAVGHTGTTGSESQSGVVWQELFNDQEKRIPAAIAVGDTLTIGELVTYIANMPDFARPTRGNSDEIALAVEECSREFIIEREFNKRGLRDQPWFKERITNKREEIIFSRMVMQMRDTSSVTQEEVRKYYDEHRDDFVTPNLVRLVTMCFGSENVAEKAAHRLAKGEDFGSVAVDMSVFSAQEPACDTTEFIGRGDNLELYDALWDKTVGSIAGPVLHGEFWYLGKLLERQGPRLYTFEESAPTITRNLKLARADEALTRLIEELRAKTKIAVNEEALEALKLPQ